MYYDKFKMLKHVSNLRDLGGIQTTDGYVFKNNMIFRSGHLGEMKRQEKRYFDQLKIRYIIDFRSKEELKDDGEDYKSNATYYNIAALEKVSNNPTSPIEILRFLKSINEQQIDDKIEEFRVEYRQMPFGNPAYKKMFECMNDGKPILLHCTAGKDRTGIAVALILRAFNVDRETIVQDYMESNVRRRRKNKSTMMKARLFVRDKTVLKAIHMLLYVNEEFLLSALDEIDKRYPNYNDFLLKEYGVTKETVDKWREFYLDNNGLTVFSY